MLPERNRGTVRTCMMVAVLALAPACKDDPAAVKRDYSAKARVLPKSGEVWGRDLANGLALEEWELCRELGQLDCVSEAHRITLGGVEPARLGIDEPLETTPVSAPIAVDRVALSACSLRYERDVEGPAVIFGPVLDANRSSRFDWLQAREQVAQSLVRRLLSRDPKAEEVEALVATYDALDGISDNVLRDGSIGACMVVATSTEALFY